MGLIQKIKEGLFRYQEADHGYIARFSDVHKFLKAVENARDAGVKELDTFTPFPIHGLEKAMGIKRSWINFWTLVFGLCGVTAAFSFMVFVDVFNWPMNIGGKPHFAWPAYIPISFELTVLFGGLGTVGALIYLGRLGKINRPLPARGVTSDTMALWVGDNIGKEKFDSIVAGLADETFEIQQGENE
ncbi:MAG: DUF3341 domain-containing protein [Candidatus Hydrogenedentota bacterium]|nr:MAG: DUF3341 domain-containing protein [Candidatus Hydrogenedentota bacterium]